MKMLSKENRLENIVDAGEVCHRPSLFPPRLKPEMWTASRSIKLYSNYIMFMLGECLKWLCDQEFVSVYGVAVHMCPCVKERLLDCGIRVLAPEEPRIS